MPKKLNPEQERESRQITARRVAAEKAEREAAVGAVATEAARLSNANDNKSQSISALNTQVSNLSNANDSKTASIQDLVARVNVLENFRTRTAGFASQEHSHNYAGPNHGHSWSDLPSNGVHGNEKHAPNYVAV